MPFSRFRGNLGELRAPWPPPKPRQVDISPKSALKARIASARLQRSRKTKRTQYQASGRNRPFSWVRLRGKLKVLCRMSVKKRSPQNKMLSFAFMFERNYTYSSLGPVARHPLHRHLERRSRRLPSRGRRSREESCDQLLVHLSCPPAERPYIEPPCVGEHKQIGLAIKGAKPAQGPWAAPMLQLRGGAA